MSSDRFKTRWLYKNRIIIIGVAIIVITHLIAMITNKAGIFGRFIYGGGDNQAELLGYVAEFKHKIQEGENVFYTWKAAGGLSFYLPFVTCLTSLPLLILSLFPYEFFNDVCDLLIVLHSVLMFISIRYYLVNRESGKRIDKDSYMVLIFSVPYALAPAFYNMALYIPFLIDYILMPIVILGLERIVYKNAWKMYFISLILLVVNDTYLGMIGCIFIVSYYFTLKFESMKDFVFKSVNVLVISVIAVLTSAFYFVPQLYASANEGYGFNEFRGVGFYVNWFKIIDAAQWGTPLNMAGNDTGACWEGNFYIGALIIIMAVAYFFVSDIKLFERIKKLSILIFMLLGINGKMFNYVFHLFHYTHGIHNRHVMYMFVFVIALAVDAYSFYIGTLKKKDKLCFLMTAVFLLVVDAVSGLYNNKISFFSYIVTIVFLILYPVLILMRRKVRTDIWRVIITLLLIVEVCSSYILTFEPKGEDVYNNAISMSIEESINHIDLSGAYRLSYNDSGTGDNRGMVYGYNSMVGFSGSCIPGYCNELKKLGIGASDMAVGESGYNAFLNSIFSKKYMFEPMINQNSGTVYISKNDAFFLDSKTNQVGNMNYALNTRCINPIVVSEGDVENYNSNSKGSGVDKNRVKDYNNELCRALTGVSDLVSNSKVEYKIEQTSKCDANVQGGVLTVKKDTGKANDSLLGDYPYVILSFEAPECGEYSVYALTNRNIGELDKGEKAYVLVSVPDYLFNDDLIAECSIITNRLDIEKWNEAYDILSSNQMDIKEFYAGHIGGTLTSDDNKFVFSTIPYDTNWKVVVDGDEVKTSCVGDGFLGFNVKKGEHQVEMDYVTGGVGVGIIVSALSLVFSFLMLVVERNNINT